jgi:hypothetical protein
VAKQLTSTEVAAIIRRFLDGTGGKWEWDDFTSISILDPVLDGVRRTCAELPDRYPPVRAGHHCGDEGFQILHALVRDLSVVNDG